VQNTFVLSDTLHKACMEGMTAEYAVGRAQQQCEARFKKLSATLRASGITVEKFVLTSWTVKAADLNTGEEIYHSTEIPEKQSWASEELALDPFGVQLRAAHLLRARQRHGADRARCR